MSQVFSAHPTTPVFSHKGHDTLARRSNGDLLEQLILLGDGDDDDNGESDGNGDGGVDVDVNDDLALPFPVLPHAGHLAALRQPEQTLPMPPSVAK